jgi:transcription elongation factor Elf1
MSKWRKRVKIEINYNPTQWVKPRKCPNCGDRAVVLRFSHLCGFDAVCRTCAMSFPVGHIKIDGQGSIKSWALDRDYIAEYIKPRQTAAPGRDINRWINDALTKGGDVVEP